MQCAPFSLKTVNIYKLGTDNGTMNFALSAKLTDQDFPCSPDTRNRILQASAHFLGEIAPKGLDDEIEWNVHTICSEITLWMFDDDAEQGSTSLVGILSSSAFQRLISNYLDRVLCNNLRVLVKASSILYCNGEQALYAGRNYIELCSICSFYGTKVLEGIDDVLRKDSPKARRCIT